MVKEFSLRINIVNFIITTFSIEEKSQKSISNGKFEGNIILFKGVTKSSMSLNPKKTNKTISKMTSKKEKKIIIFLLVTLFIKDDEQGDEKKMTIGKHTEKCTF
jgi:hypothetical protein